MSLDITIKQGNKKIYTNNFYGFIHFNNSEKRHELAKAMNPENVTDYDSYCEFISKSVESNRQQIYLDLVNKKDNINVIIF